MVNTPRAVALKNLPNIELVAVGSWPASTGPVTITPSDLRQALAARECPAVGAPVIKLGHEEPNPDEKHMRWDGEPAIGWVSNLRMSDNKAKLLGDYTGVPGWLADVMASAYPRRSVEINKQLKCQIGHTHPFVITAVSLLGIKPPAVGAIKSLHDVRALYTQADGPAQLAIQVGDRVCFATVELHLPGKHNQKSHGNKAHRPAIRNVPGKTGLARLASLALAHSIFEKGMAMHVAKKQAAETAANDAKIAAKQAQIEKKWKGKPLPKPPKLPEPPHVDKARFLDGWLAKVNDRYDKQGTGKKLSESLNYSYVKTALGDPGSPAAASAIDYLEKNHYLDANLVHEYFAAAGKADQAAKDALTDAAYKKQLTAFKRATTLHKRNLAQWKEVNGKTGNLNGMDGARTLDTNEEGVAWGKANFPAPTDHAAYSALVEYTGSTYTSWNGALRKAKGGKLSTSWATKTKHADSGLTEFPEDVILVRGTKMDEFQFPDGSRTSSLPPPDPMSLIGSVQTQHGYMSTSVGTSPGYGGSQVFMRVRVPKGHKGSYVSGFAANEGERELLLQRGTQVFIHDIRPNDHTGTGWIVEAEVLPPDVTPDSVVGHPVMPLSK